MSAAVDILPAARRWLDPGRCFLPFHPPDLDSVRRCAAEARRSPLAEHRQGFLKVGRVKISASFDGGEHPAGKAHRRNPHVLCFNARMHPPRQRPADPFRFALSHPAQQINPMDALVHQDTPVARPAPAPIRLPVICVVPVPAQGQRRMGKSAEPSRVERAAQRHHSRIKAVLMAGDEAEPPFPRTSDHLIRVGEGKGNRLLHNHMRPRIETVERHPGMDAAFRGDSRQLRTLAVQQLPVVRIDSGAGLPQPGPAQQFPAPLQNRIADGDHLQRGGARCGKVPSGNPSAADQRVAHDAPPFYKTVMFSRGTISFIAFLVSKICLAFFCTNE